MMIFERVTSVSPRFTGGGQAGPPRQQNIPQAAAQPGALGRFNYPIPYLPASSVLFGRRKITLAEELFPNSIGNSRFKQGRLPDCQTMAATDALLNHPAGAKLIAGLIQREADGRYKVVFPGHPTLPVWVTEADVKRLNLNERIDLFAKRSGVALKPAQRERYRKLLRMLPNGRFKLTTQNKRELGRTLSKLPLEGRIFSPNVRGDKGIRIIENAYARLNKAMYPQKYAHIADADMQRVFLEEKHFHYNSGIALRDMTGWPVKTTIADGGTEPEKSGSFAEEELKTPGIIRRMTQTLNRLAKTPEKYVMTTCTRGNLGNDTVFMEKKRKIIAWHDYSLRHIDADKQEVTVANPHNTRTPVTLSYSDFFKYYNLISVAKVPQK